jgi:hypothetical protein
MVPTSSCTPLAPLLHAFLKFHSVLPSKATISVAVKRKLPPVMVANEVSETTEGNMTGQHIDQQEPSHNKYSTAFIMLVSLPWRVA